VLGLVRQELGELAVTIYKRRMSPSSHVETADQERMSVLYELSAAIMTGSETNSCQVVLPAGWASSYVCAAINTLDCLF
jgi:hypothetical protein